MSLLFKFSSQEYLNNWLIIQLFAAPNGKKYIRFNLDASKY